MRERTWVMFEHGEDGVTGGVGSSISVNRSALARLLERMASGGFLSNELGVKYVADEHGRFTTLVSDAEITGSIMACEVAPVDAALVDQEHPDNQEERA